MIEIVATGPFASIQDLGRIGWSHIGVGPSGAWDRGALRLANRLVGNPENAAVIEAVGGGLHLRVEAACVVAVTGAEGALVVNHMGQLREIPRDSQLHLGAGDELIIRAPTWGLRSYLAVRHGIKVDPVLGSASTDTLARLGPQPLAARDRLELGHEEVEHPPIDHAAHRRPNGPLRAIAGPRFDWFTAKAASLLVTSSWIVTPASDRIGLRLSGPALERRDPGRELPTEPMETGAIQVPHDGQPVVLGPDRPTTGGYSVIAVIIDADRDRLAQVQPGDVIEIRLIELPDTR
ncbi:MAG: biotin-dependent carboxyltransferase family protein [Actinomycetes bacterium]